MFLDFILYIYLNCKTYFHEKEKILMLEKMTDVANFNVRKNDRCSKSNSLLEETQLRNHQVALVVMSAKGEMLFNTIPS